MIVLMCLLVMAGCSSNDNSNNNDNKEEEVTVPEEVETGAVEANDVIFENDSIRLTITSFERKEADEESDEIMTVSFHIEPLQENAGIWIYRAGINGLTVMKSVSSELYDSAIPFGYTQTLNEPLDTEIRISRSVLELDGVDEIRELDLIINTIGSDGVLHIDRTVYGFQGNGAVGSQVSAVSEGYYAPSCLTYVTNKSDVPVKLTFKVSVYDENGDTIYLESSYFDELQAFMLYSIQVKGSVTDMPVAMSDLFNQYYCDREGKRVSEKAIASATAELILVSRVDGEDISEKVAFENVTGNDNTVKADVTLTDENIKKADAYITLLIYENGELASVQSQNRTFSEGYQSITFNPHGKRAANETYEFIVNYAEEVND